MCYIFITYQAFLYEWLLSSHYRGIKISFSPKTHQHRPRAFQGSEGLEHSWSFSLPSWKNNLFSIINFLDYKTFVIHHCIVFSASKMSFQSFHEVWAQLPCWYFGSQLSRVNFIGNVLFRARLFSSALSLLVQHVSCFSNSYLRCLAEGLPVVVLGRSWSSPWRSSSPRTWWRFLQDPPATIISVISATIFAMMLLPGNVNTTPSPSRHTDDPNWIKHKSKKCKNIPGVIFSTMVLKTGPSPSGAPFSLTTLPYQLGSTRKLDFVPLVKKLGKF